MGKKVQGIKSITGRHEIDGEVKNSIRSGEAKELICTTHGHELRGGECWSEEGCRVEGNKGEK